MDPTTGALSFTAPSPSSSNSSDLFPSTPPHNTTLNGFAGSASCALTYNNKGWAACPGIFEIGISDDADDDDFLVWQIYSLDVELKDENVLGGNVSMCTEMEIKLAGFYDEATAVEFD